ncbi:hypothetical protein KY382_34750, partial [Pseudomonas monteilii]|nr:hypothetical protein [Pseudomonas monteilii]
TGMCIVVALIGPKGINPRKGTDAKRIKIPKKKAVKTSSKVDIFFIVRHSVLPKQSMLFQESLVSPL